MLILNVRCKVKYYVKSSREKDSTKVNKMICMLIIRNMHAFLKVNKSKQVWEKDRADANLQLFYTLVEQFCTAFIGVEQFFR